MFPLFQAQKIIKYPLFITSQPDLYYLSGFRGGHGSLIVMKKRAYFFTDPRYTELARATLYPGIELITWGRGQPDFLKNFLRAQKITQLGFDATRWTVAEHKLFVKKLGTQIKLLPLENPLGALREIKNSNEIKYMQQAGKITVRIFSELKQGIRLGMTEREVAWQIRMLAQKFGAEDIAFDSIVAFGTHSSVPHHHPQSTRLKKGDIIQLDFGVQVEGYKSDMSRVLFAGAPDSVCEGVFARCLKMQTEALRSIRAGIKIADLTKKFLPEMHLPSKEKTTAHNLGHGVGLEIHEAPSLNPLSKLKLQTNQVITIEPGIYHEGCCGIRIEDTVLVTKDGFVNLTPAPKSLTSSILKIGK